ncbi:MAG: hypothetical protein U5L72_18875 [Bacteroidales bacterium]|nr:hypothetical protein [Bacteroidales bacterium]
MVGDDVTVNVRTIRSIPVRVTAAGIPSLFVMRGEMYLPRKGFDEMDAARQAEG